MAFVKKTWIDRVVQYANRRLLTKSGGEVEQVTVTRDEGTVSVAGDKFDAATMNDLENRIYTADTNMKAYIDGKTGSDIDWETGAGVSISTLIRHLLMTEQTDLNSSINAGTSTPRITYYPSTATNKPSGNSGVVITQGNGTYRQQLAIDLEGNIYARYYNNGTISSWVAKSEKTDGFSLTAPTNVQLAVNKSHYISSKIVHIFCQVKVTANLSNQPIITWTPTCDNAGITIPLFSGNGQWSPADSIIYGYLGSNGINANANTTNAWVTIDQIIRLA